MGTSRSLSAREWSQLYAPGGRADAAALPYLRVAARLRDLALPRVRAASRWLDLGTGPGWLARALSDAGARVAGVDLDPEMLRCAVEAAEEAAGTPPHFLRGDAAALPFPDRSIDGVTAASVLGCFQDPAPVLAEIARVLRPGGLLIVSCTRRDNWLARAQRFVNRRGLSAGLSTDGQMSGYRLFTPDEMGALLRQAGMTTERVVDFNACLVVGQCALPTQALLPRLEATLAHWGPASQLTRNFAFVATAPG